MPIQGLSHLDSNFEKAIRFSIGDPADPSAGYEKYWADNPGDPGGLTIWGICTKWWPDHVRAMKTQSKADAFLYAKHFYHQQFWLWSGCDKLASGLDLVAFDTAILTGRERTAGWIKICHDWRDIIFLRLDYQAGLDRINKFFIEGWLERAIALWKLVKV